MGDDLKFWLTLLSAAGGGAITAYISTQAGYWRIDSRIKLLEYRTDKQDQRLDRIEIAQTRERSTPT